MTRRFEFKDAKSNKFWEITVTGRTITVRYGRIGTGGNRKETLFVSPDAAQAAADKQIGEKVSKGYREVSGTMVKKSARKSPQKTSAQTSEASQTDKPVGQKHLSEVRKLLAQSDGAAVRQGIALLRALDDPGLWSTLAEGISIDARGKIIVAKGGEIHKRVKAAFRTEVALWALRGVGQLQIAQRLDLEQCSLTTLDALRDLTALQALDLSECASLVSLDGIQGLRALQSLSLYKCHALTSLDGIECLVALQFLNLSGCGRVSNIDNLRGLIALRELYLQNCGALATITDCQVLSALVALRELELSYTIIPSASTLTSLNGIESLTSLENLDLQGSRSLKDFTGLHCLRALKSLNVWGVGYRDELAKQIRGMNIRVSG